VKSEELVGLTVWCETVCITEQFQLKLGIRNSFS